MKPFIVVLTLPIVANFFFFGQPADKKLFKWVGRQYGIKSKVLIPPVISLKYDCLVWKYETGGGYLRPGYRIDGFYNLKTKIISIDKAFHGKKRSELLVHEFTHFFEDFMGESTKTSEIRAEKMVLKYRRKED